nr:redoxin family protein [Solirubrobacteraceae bacterium]
WPMPYLHDETQDVAEAYGAQTTPDVFVIDGEGRIAYRGAPDSDWEDERQDADWLRAALDDVLAGRVVGHPESTPVGCSIKWRP